MGNLHIGSKIGSWDSRAGQADITVKRQLPGKFDNLNEARTAIAKSGEAGAIIMDGREIEAYIIDDGAYLDDLDIGDKPKASNGLAVFDFINDEAESINLGVEILPPRGPDNGKIVHVFMSYSSVMDKVSMRTPKQLSTADDLSRLQDLGYTVQIDRSATQAEFKAAAYDPHTAGILWFGHGGRGTVVDHNRQIVRSSDLNPQLVSPNLSLMIFESCQVGKDQSGWENSMPNALVHSWDRNVRNYESTYFNIHNGEGGLDNLIGDHLGGVRAQTTYQSPFPNAFAGGMMGKAFGGLLGAAGAAQAASSSKRPVPQGQ